MDRPPQQERVKTSEQLKPKNYGEFAGQILAKSKQAESMPAGALRDRTTSTLSNQVAGLIQVERYLGYEWQAEHHKGFKGTGRMVRELAQGRTQEEENARSEYIYNSPIDKAREYLKKHIAEVQDQYRRASGNMSLKDLASQDVMAATETKDISSKIRDLFNLQDMMES